MTDTVPERKMALICAKGGLDECYPALILANAARMSGIDCMIFFTFYGLDVVTEDRVDHLHVNMVGNPSSPMPPFIAGLPGMELLASSMMRRKLDELDLPGPREMLGILHEAGCTMYGCELAMRMFGRTREDLLPVVEDVITATDFYDLTAGAHIVFV
ncbi:MAG: DsrE/DsrF/DrsH-like family protein [Alphaproteobacteria bacterium]|nr:DsrE/DsrF/DrsH-like family protein [Alphaproteobacteria bacterium]